MRNVVEVDNRAKFPRLLELLGRRVVRRKHYRLADVAHLLGKNKLGHRRAVATEVKLLQKLHEVRVRRRLYGEVFAEALVPCKRLLQATRVLADRLRVIDVKRRRPLPRRFLDPRLVKWKLSHFVLALPGLNLDLGGMAVQIDCLGINCAKRKLHRQSLALDVFDVRI